MLKKISSLLILSTLVLTCSTVAFAQETDPAASTVPAETAAEATAGQPAAETAAENPAEERTPGQPTEEQPLEVTAQPFNNEGFTITPANPNTINPRKFLFELKPGDQADDFVEIRNLSGSEQTFLLYGADPTFSAQGTPAYKTRQAGGSAEGAWVKFEEPEVVLGPDETKIAKFTVTVPHEAAEGEYRAGIAMEKSKQDVENPGITIATRIILHAGIKVTNTPNAVPKQDGTYTNGTNTEEHTKQDWKAVYFWISLILFIASFIALIWVTLQERKQKLSKPAPAATAKTTKAKPAKTAGKKPAGKPKKKTSAKTRKSTTKKAAAKKTTTRKKTTKKAPAKKTTKRKTTKKK